MRALLISVVFMVAVAVISAYPSDSILVSMEDVDDEASNLLPLENGVRGNIDVHSRQKRATCDLLSIFGVGHAACAAHCLGHGFRGGYCDSKAVCRCRR
ncbi:Defensin [Sergentomyia squamirostris]